MRVRCTCNAGSMRRSVFPYHDNMLIAPVCCKMRQLYVSDIYDAVIMQTITLLTCFAALSPAGIHHHVVRCVCICMLADMIAQADIEVQLPILATSCTVPCGWCA